MKNKDEIHKNALNTVISECQVAKGRGNLTNNDDVADYIKKAIKIYSEEQESTGKDNSKELEYLKSFLPVSLTEDQIRDLLKDQSFKNPKQAMEHLDNLGYKGSYDKGFVAKIVLGK